MRLPHSLRTWLSWRDWRYFFAHRVGGFFQRGRRGWADHDTWSFDTYLAGVLAGGLRPRCAIRRPRCLGTYLAGVLAGGLRRLADKNHGYPCDFPGEAEGWQAWLRDKADWFEWYAKDGIMPSDQPYHTLSQEERRARMDAYRAKMDKFFEEVLPDFVKYFGNLWD